MERITTGVITSCKRLFKLKLQLNKHRVVSTSLFIHRNQSTATASKQVNDAETVLPFHALPGAKGVYTLPFIGSILQMKPFTKYGIRDIAGRVESWHQEYGDIFRMRFGGGWAVYVFNPDDIMATHRADGKYPHRVSFDLPKAYTKRNKREPSLVELNDEAWYRIRQPTQQKMLRPAAVANYVPVINGVADDFIELLKKRDRMEDTRHLMVQYATESVGMLCFNQRIGCFDSDDMFEEIASDLRDIFELFGDSVFHILRPYRWFKTPIYNRYERKINKIFSIVEKYTDEATAILESKLEISKEESENEPNLLKDLLSDPRLTNEQVSRVIIDLFATGIDSTSNSMTFLLYQLAKHQGVQQKLFDEVNMLTPEDGKLNRKAVNQMFYLHACVRESFRVIFPIIIGATRQLQTDAVIGGYNVPKGTFVLTCTMFSSMDERTFDRPKEYIPERWLRDNEGKRQFHPFATLPFGFGPRSCIGQRFAEQEIYICLAKLIKNFKLKLPPGGDDLKYVYKTFATTDVPLSILLEQR